MKNIFIGGVAKSGKSRLATYLSKELGMNHIPMDYFASSFKHNFPELGIVSNVIIDKESSKKLALFLSRFIDIAQDNNEEYFILDSAHILPEDIAPYLDKDKWDIYYLGYPNVNVVDKIEEVNKYTPGGWIAKRSSDELLDTFNNLIDLSNKIKNTCEDNNITYLDVSGLDPIDVYKKYKDQ